ncbi:hypothetical protein BDY24DRAFT_395302 [Mrakia frigida]|uniref:uncharacterized protein n=1 Tax=Mrakia frigida TaxID=29902 RepID=UPI003FCC1FE2
MGLRQGILRGRRRSSSLARHVLGHGNANLPRPPRNSSQVASQPSRPSLHPRTTLPLLASREGSRRSSTPLLRSEGRSPSTRRNPGVGRNGIPGCCGDDVWQRGDSGALCCSSFPEGGGGGRGADVGRDRFGMDSGGEEGGVGAVPSSRETSPAGSFGGWIVSLQREGGRTVFGVRVALDGRGGVAAVGLHDRRPSVVASIGEHPDLSHFPLPRSRSRPTSRIRRTEEGSTRRLLGRVRQLLHVGTGDWADFGDGGRSWSMEIRGRGRGRCKVLV